MQDNLRKFQTFSFFMTKEKISKNLFGFQQLTVQKISFLKLKIKKNNKGHQKAKDADSNLFFPLVTSKVFPDCVLNLFRFGVDQPSTKDEKHIIAEMKPLTKDKI